MAYSILLLIAGVLTLFVALPLATLGFACLFKWRPLLLIVGWSSFNYFVKESVSTQFVLTLGILLILGIIATILAFMSLSSIVSF